MNIHQSIGIVSRSFPVTIRNYWFGQHPMKNPMPAIYGGPRNWDSVPSYIWEQKNSHQAAALSGTVVFCS
jgi:hypothetical protein